MAAKLDAVTFHNKLGTQAERIARIAALAREIAPAVGADPDLAERAARLAKADLASQMVYEFPELQGTMGRYYALPPAKTPPSPPPPPSTTRPSAPPTPSRPPRSPSPSRSPTSSTCSPASGRSTRSRPGPRTPLRCAGRPWE